MLVAGTGAQNCSAPPPAANFNFDGVMGAWYEIARIQTAGGNALQQFCACTQLIFTPANDGVTGDANATNSCRFLSPSGFFLNATSSLTDMGPAGHWQERFCPTCPAASYNIILAGTGDNGVDWAVEYDCADNEIFGSNYCLHFLSRKPDGMNATLLGALVQQTTGAMGLNPLNRPLNITLQERCW